MPVPDLIAFASNMIFAYNEGERATHHINSGYQKRFENPRQASIDFRHGYIAGQDHRGGDDDVHRMLRQASEADLWKAGVHAVEKTSLEELDKICPKGLARHRGPVLRP